MSEKTILETRNLTKRYNGVTALNNVSLRVSDGEFLSIMGPSGSGKTTLLNLIGALDQPTEGEVVVRGTPLKDVRDLDAFRNKEIGFVFQFQNLIPTLTALENVETPMHELRISKAARRERAERMLLAVGLDDRADHRPRQLSGGERQRVAIARALVNDPALILADEPTGELDSATGQQIVSLMKSLNRERKKTFIIVTHDPNVAKRTDRIIHLKDGMIERDERVRSELLEDLISFRNSSLGKKILNAEAAEDRDLERLKIFSDGRLGKRGETLRELFLELHKCLGADG